MKLIVFRPAFGEMSGSPFCVKAACMLKLAGVDWEVSYLDDPRKMPKAKLPVLDDNGTLIPDSDQIRDYLEQRTGIDFDAGLTPSQRATGRAVIRMVEEHLYFAVLSDRWMGDASWEHIKATFFAHLPFPLSLFLPGLIRKDVFKQARAQGMGRHSEEERLDRARHDIDAIRDLLADKPFLFGETPSAADITVVTMLSTMAGFPERTALSRLVADDPLLMDYVKRGRATFYPE